MRPRTNHLPTCLAPIEAPGSREATGLGERRAEVR
jgi:hypothetical protein